MPSDLLPLSEGCRSDTLLYIPPTRTGARVSRSLSPSRTLVLSLSLPPPFPRFVFHHVESTAAADSNIIAPGDDARDPGDAVPSFVRVNGLVLCLEAALLPKWIHRRSPRRGMRAWAQTAGRVTRIAISNDEILNSTETISPAASRASFARNASADASFCPFASVTTRAIIANCIH